MEQQQNELNAASRETVLTSAGASPALHRHSTTVDKHIYANRLGSDALYPNSGGGSPIMNHRDLIARSGMAPSGYGQQQQYRTLQHNPGYYSPQLGGAGGQRGVSTDPNGGYANLISQGATLPRHPGMPMSVNSLGGQWRGSAGYLPSSSSSSTFQHHRVPPIGEHDEQIPSDLGLPTSSASPRHLPGHRGGVLNPDRVFSPIRESQTSLHLGGAGSPSRLMYHERPSAAASDPRNSVAIGYSSNASASPATPVARPNQQQVLSPSTVSSSDQSRSSPMKPPSGSAAGAGKTHNNRTSESPDEGIQDDCSTDV